MSNLWVLVSGGQGTQVREYPYSPQKLRSDNPDTSYPNAGEEDLVWLARERVMPVTPTERPAYHPSRVIVEINPKRIDGAWTQQWAELDADPASVDQLLEHAKECRRVREASGTVVAGIPVDTDDRGQSKIMGARLACLVDPEWTTIWSGSDGGSYPLDAAAVAMVSNAVVSHVSECFKVYAGAKAAIIAGTITTYAQVEEAFA